MALKSSREGLRKELVDYLGNIIIDDNLKQNIINSVDDTFINNQELNTSVNELDEKIANETLARESADSNLESNKANKSDVLTFEEIQATTDLTGKIASASALNHLNTYKLNGSIKVYSQRASNIILSFRGNILTRALAGFIVISGQSGITEPISFSFVGSGVYEDITQWEAIVCSNSYGIVGRNNGTIYIPANIGSGWGYINVILLKDNLDFSISYE